ncbi:substrate-binding periplasmic protein [Fluviispira sanaruensis]|uniref:ABC transporter substrate-binding protein n=1 Tax=Fluviispira sanaruensis TaxID=2493639 RepID=A0A4P2VN54_FLUSA|nr:transporter substrate-binding domain-containing protein [Fluviispira sanaruensis]BBH52979.1 ABC transporter substrate-binding protein [Fluviispira sanaruensis]
MLNKKFILIFIVFFSFQFKQFAFSLKKEPIKISFYDSFAPFSYKENGQTKGIFIDIAQLILHDMMGYEVQIDSFPWGRAQDLVKKAEFDSHITAKTTEREKFLLFPNTEIISSNVALVYSKESKKIKEILKINKKDELNNYKMVGYIGDGWAKEQFHDDKDVKFFRTANLVDVLKMVDDNSADIYVSSNEKADKYLAKKHAFKNLRFKSIYFLKPASVHFYFCLRKEFPESEKIMNEFEKNLIRVKKSGKISRIIHKYY